MASSLLQIFEQYQKARVQFVQSVAEAATRPQNIDVMQNAGVMQLLRPLLLDNVRSGCERGGWQWPALVFPRRGGLQKEMTPVAPHPCLQMCMEKCIPCPRGLQRAVHATVSASFQGGG